MDDGSRTTIDGAGRVVVPKAIREQAGLAPGSRLTVRYREGRIEIEPDPRKVRMKRHGGLTVAVPEEEGPLLTADEVRDTLERLRRREE
jgi:AbrB family looped-hinge helix DNA binding protein